MHERPAALSVNEAARYIGISRANLYRLFQSGELTPTRIGGRTLVRRVDADALLEKSVGAAESKPRRTRRTTTTAPAGIWS